MAKVQQNLNRVSLAGGEVADFTGWQDEMVEDYLSVHDEIDFLGDAIDKIASETSVPLTATSSGVEGQIAKDNNYLYVCIAANTWRRTALSVW